MNLRIAKIDPQGAVALSLLRAAAAEIRPLYAAATAATAAPMPGNARLGTRDIYVAAMLDDVAVACASLRELDSTSCEIHRMYVLREHRGRHLGHTLLLHLVSESRRLGYRRLCLETGNKQPAAIALYQGFGFTRIAPFGEHASDPTSVCYELRLEQMKQRRCDGFFYGLFMDVIALRELGVEPVDPRPAYVDGFALRIGSRATLLASAGARAYGMVIALTYAELDRLYTAPGLDQYRAEALVAQLLSGGSAPALCYNLLAEPRADEKNSDYAARLHETLQRLGGFPAEYVDSVTRL